ncbi:MAG: hypothetical protein DME98_11175 [Verrucomicrobia bacterium]|nr:MAG: hypothetical protein DME98_11175 [Verrucomicrobiota bacterium]
MFMKRLQLLFWFVCVLCALSPTSRVFGHGFAGARFFPATLSTDDPFVSDELSLPTVSTIRTPDNGGTRETDISVDIAKRVTPQFGIEIGETLTVVNPHEGQTTNGFGNLELGGKYQLLKNDAHEAIVSVGLGVEIGGTGSSSIGADLFSTWAPGIFFGKGFGDLPEALRFLKPLALTGSAGITIPTSASTRTITVNPRTGESDVEVEHNPDVLQLGFALEYSVIYLQSQVQDMHLPAPIDRLIPLVEFALETPLNRGARGQTTGTINPGVIWAGKYFQVGMEAVVPINEHTGNKVGVIAQLHFFLDDLFPHTIGRPLFGGNK